MKEEMKERKERERKDTVEIISASYQHRHSLLRYKN
jgi:hypothetical protein